MITTKEMQKILLGRGYGMSATEAMQYAAMDQSDLMCPRENRRNIETYNKYLDDMEKLGAKKEKK